MINATIFLKDGLYQGFKISGHAGYANHGNDIVCAGVSMLAIATVNSLIQQIDNKLDYRYDDDGLLSCTLHEDLDSESMIRAQAILHTLSVGLEAVNIEYPKHIALKKKK